MTNAIGLLWRRLSAEGPGGAENIGKKPAAGQMMQTVTDTMGRCAGKLPNQDRGLWENIQDFFTGLVEKLRNAYQDAEPDSEIAKILKRAIQDNEALAEAWASAVVDAGENYQLQDGQKKNAQEGVTETGVRYSTRNLSNQIDEVANQTFDTKNHVNYGSTPKALSNILSLPILPMLGTYTHAYTMALSQQQAQAEGRRTKGLNFHELGWDTVKNIPDMLNHPVAIIKSNTDVNDSRFVVVTNDVDKAGRPIIVAISPKGTGNYYGLKLMDTALLSSYGRNNLANYVATAKTENRIIWINKNNHQKQANPGVQFPNVLLSGDYTDNLAQFKQIVKREFQGTIFQNTFDDDGNRLFSSRNTRDSDGNQLTENQARYFENSRVRDDEGNLKVVYHSTFEDFYTFDRGRLGENTLGNASNAGLAATSLIGHWFSDHDLSGQLGEKTTMSYLNMENPHVVSSLDDLASEIIALSDDPDMIQDEYEYGNYEPLREAAAAYVDALRNEGYDGIITTDEEFGGNSYVVLDSAQAKLTTNLNPTQNPDIRYSQRVREGDQVERLAKQNEVLEKEVEYLKELVKIQKRGNKDNILILIYAPARGATRMILSM